MTITFFGHHDTPAHIQPHLENELKKLLAKNQNTHFFVGNHGSFDRIVLSTIQHLMEYHPQITYDVVLAYLPQNVADVPHSIYPEGLERVPPRYAISKRNEWMIANSDTVITYVTRSCGGAAHFVTLAEKKGKKVINLANRNNE